MPYIDKAYYENEYKGLPIIDQALFDRLTVRASDLIDQLSSYQIQDFNALTSFQQIQVRKAAAAQVEYMANQGGELSIHGGSPSSVNIGNFSYQAEKEQPIVSPAVIGYLWPTGLLYRGVSTNDC